MLRRWLALLAVVGVIGVGMAMLLYFSLREPTYKGRPLSEWVGDLGLVSDTVGVDPEERRRAQEAIRQIGADAIPHLLHWVQHGRLSQHKFVRWMRDSYQGNVRTAAEGLITRVIKLQKPSG